MPATGGTRSVLKIGGSGEDYHALFSLVSIAATAICLHIRNLGPRITEQDLWRVTNAECSGSSIAVGNSRNAAVN